MKNNMNNEEPNIIVWSLSIAPLLGVAIQALVSNLTTIRFNTLWVITIAINVAIAIYDAELLKKQGLYNQEMGNPMSVPVYLFKRSKILDQSPIYLVIWSLSLALVVFIPSWVFTSMAGLIWAAK